MTAKTVRVRDAQGREFDTLAAEARRLGYTVLPEPGTVSGSAPKTSATPAAEKKNTKAAVIDSESAPTSEGTNR